MGPISGIRIVNLRVRDKVAYPDLTIDLAGPDADHLVIGLENGGGKSTLLGAVYHVFVPEADQFLPRRAQRRQHKEGELKRLEQYVPGGDPTHFIVEVESPTHENGAERGPRLLAGACLWKPAGSSSSTQASEFFWSARSVAPALSLREFGLRGPGGRLLDFREFKARLKALRTEVPAAHVNLEEAKGAWEAHLRGLGIDVEYVRQFLLRMNEDEGAADQVFTYASSRAFLNSLVGVVGDPAAIDELKERLADMSRDADAMTLDRQRVKLLDVLAAQTGPLASTMRSLEERVAERDRMAGYLLASQHRLTSHLGDLRDASLVATAQRTERERAMNEARGVYNDAHAVYMLARVQVARVKAVRSEGEIEEAQREQDRTRIAENIARAAALLAKRRTDDARIRDLERLLESRALEAEPLRRSLSSALQSLRRRLDTDMARFAGERAEATAAVARANADLENANSMRAAEEKILGELDGERKGLFGERTTLQQQFAAAVVAGVLPHVDAEPATELEHARSRARSEKLASDEHEQRRQHAADRVAALSQRDNALASDSGRAEEALKRARSELERAIHRTNEITTSIVDSGFIDVPHVQLGDHVDSIRLRLEAAIETARRKQAAAAVSVAAAERAAMWLRDQERLPPRPDVERICERARADRLGARPGWTYLSTLARDTAAGYAAARPGLADGIVVNVPEDLDAVIALVMELRAELEAPMIVGLAAAFDEADSNTGCTVVLPGEAHWSTSAGRELLETRNAEAVRWREEHDGAQARAENALRLRDRIVTWTSEIGPGGLDRLRASVQEHAGIGSRLVAEREGLAREVAGKTSEQRAAEADRDQARSREHELLAHCRELETLAKLRPRIDAITARLDTIDGEETRTTVARDAALAAIATATSESDVAAARVEMLAQTIGEISTELTSVVALASIAVRPTDPVDPEDESADRQLLAHTVDDRETRWRSAVTDPELRMQLVALQAAVAESEKQLRPYANVSDRARVLVGNDPAVSADDYVRDAEAARKGVEKLAGRIGVLEATQKQAARELETVNDEFKALRRPAELAPIDTTEDVERAVSIRDRLKIEQSDAMNIRTAREADHASAIRSEKALDARRELLDTTLQRLSAACGRLTVSGLVVPAIDVAAAEAAVDVEALLRDPGLPAALSRLLRTAGRTLDEGAEVALEADKTATNAELVSIDEIVGSIEVALSSLDKRAGEALDAIESLLRAATEDVVRGDRIIQTLRAAARPTLANLAVEHHADIAQRLAAVQHHVATFDARVDALGYTVYATIADLLREVRRTVRESQLPNTPSMGRWAGANLLEMSGLDLKVEQKRSAVATTLRVWFNPEDANSRPSRFDSNEVVHELLKAVTPQFTARILIPSDPLDPEHKPVDHLALETSGGEGVTVALILASLLASRRASTRGHRRTTLLLDNPFAKVTKPEFLRLARDVADELNVQLVAFTGIRDLAALTVFPRLTQLRVSRRENANFVVPFAIEDDRLQTLLRAGTLFVSPTEWAAERDNNPSAWPLMSAASVAAPRSRGVT